MLIKNMSKNVILNNLKQVYNNEFNFISDLLSKVDLPTQQPNSSDSEHEDKSTVIKGRRLRDTERAKSLAELHKRLAELREQKYTYKGKKLKNKLQSKLKRKKKVFENKSKRNISCKEKEIVESDCKMGNDETKLSKPIFNSEGNVVFSKFDFLGETTAVVGDSNQIKDETKWTNMFKKSEGLKVKDDPQLIKKSQARKQSKKKASEKKWAERTKAVEKQKLEKQKKRSENITKRLQEKKKKKFKKAVKKGKYIPNA